MNKLFVRIWTKIKWIFRKREIFVFGDSHTRVFDHINRKELFWKKFVISKVDGATAMGMVNPNSKTNALLKFTEDLQKLSKRRKIIFLLGEVDCGFLIWHRNQSLNLGIEDQLNKSIQNYSIFLKSVKDKGFKNVCVISSPLPCIKDDYSHYQINEVRRQISISQKERTALSLRYNLALQKVCEDYRIKYINLDKDLLEPDQLRLKDVFYSKDLKDHHLDEDEYGKLMITHLKKEFIFLYL